MTLPSPQTTLAILLGACEWPSCPTFQPSNAFANATQGVKEYLLSSHHFALPQENLLDLFNSPASVDEIDETIGRFLEERIAAMKKAGNAARDIFLYFVGHGALVGRNADFFLAIRRTRSSNIKASSFHMDILAETLRHHARHLRSVLILDCCFAGASFTSFQSHPAEAAITKTIEAFKVNRKEKGSPKRGVSLLCSSNHKTVSQLLPDFSSTMFSSALLKALAEGYPSQQKRLTLREVKDLIEDILREMPNAPRPVVHSPDQSQGDVADIPFFPNPGRQYVQKEQAPLPSEVPSITALIETDWLTFVIGFLSEGKKSMTLFDAGHILLTGGRMGKTSQAKSICLQLCAKAPSKLLHVAIFDLAANAQEWQEFRRFRQVTVITSQRDAIEQQLLKFNEELKRRQKRLASD